MEEFRDYGMKEYKAPLSLRVRNFFAAHPILVAVVFVIVISLFMGGCQKARAEEINYELTQRYFEDTFLGANNINDVSYLNDLVTNGYDYFVQMKYNDDVDIFWISKGKTAVPFSFNVSNQIIYCYHQYHFGNYETYYNATDGRGILEGIGRGGIIAYLVAYNHNSNRIEACSSMNFESGYDGTIANYNGTGYYDFVQGSNIYYNAVRTRNGYYNIFDNNPAVVDITAADTKANYHNYWFKYYSNAGAVLQLDNYFDLSEYYSSTNTPGFECYKLDTKGGIYFYADYSSLITFDHSTTNTSIFSCDIHLDDTIQTITLDSSSEYFQYDVDYKEAEYVFPITTFVPNYTDYENVWVENVKVVNTYSGHGASVDSTFVYITPVVIQGDAYQDGELVNPDDVVVPDGEYNPPTDTEIAENTYLVEFSNKDGLTFTEFHNTNLPDIYEDNTTWIYMDKQTYSFSDFIEDFFGSVAPFNLIEYITGINSKDEAVEKMTKYLYDNAFTLTSDMVIFVYIDGDWKSSDFSSNDLTYWIYYTASGRLRAISQLMNSANTNISRQLALSSSYFQYVKTKMNTIDKNLYEFSKSQLGFNNTFVSKLNNIDTLLGRIENVLNKIFDALKNLHLSQLDAIDSKLSTIIQNMGTSGGDSFNEDDTVAEAIAYYKDHVSNGLPTSQVWTDNKMSIWLAGKVHSWFQGTDASNDRTTLLSDVFDTMTSMYDAMSDEQYFFSSIKLYLESLSGTSDSDTEGDPDYIYINHFFDDTFDPDSYDGYGGGVN